MLASALQIWSLLTPEQLSRVADLHTKLKALCEQIHALVGEDALPPGPPPDSEVYRRYSGLLAPGAHAQTNQMRPKPPHADESAASLSELVARARANEDAALEELIRTYQRRIAALVISLIGNDDDWQDICQQIFVKMVLGLRRLDDLGAFEPCSYGSRATAALTISGAVARGGF